MLGMMNCPTENFEFYSASPSALRQLNSSRSGANSPKLDRSEGDSVSLDEERMNKRRGLEVFSQVKQRPKITYTPDGRRMIGGKLEAPESKPDELWGKLIVDSVTKRKFFGSQEQDSSKQNDNEESQIKIKNENQKRKFSFGSLFTRLRRGTVNNDSDRNTSPVNIQKKKTSMI
ncbi:unnamed protein product [Meloidogyne enterolobii]|uniref:Uncharacterized protein n=1 Tax=Meloidogyne enterolobii TaxID=390850 RepID=A0ACB1AQQ0_MELEN